MMSRTMRLLVITLTLGGLVSVTNAQTAMFDLGVAEDGGLHEQAGWTLIDRLTGGNGPGVEVIDAGTGWGLEIGDGGGFARDRGSLTVTPGGTFTLDDVYVDFVIGFNNLTVGNLDPNQQYDVQFIMYDDNATGGTAGSTQTVTNTTGGASDLLGVGDGVGLGDSLLTSNLDFSVFGSSLTPDANGNLTFEIINDTLNNGVAILNGLVVTQVPEPASMMLLGLGSLLWSRRRR